MANEKITFKFIQHGARLSVGTTPIKLTEEYEELDRGLVIKADPDNTAPVYVGREGLSAGEVEELCGYPLFPGDTVTIEIEDASKIYVVAASGTQKVYWLGI
jgi:hypothetical protein